MSFSRLDALWDYRLLTGFDHIFVILVVRFLSGFFLPQRPISIRQIQVGDHSVWVLQRDVFQ